MFTPTSANRTAVLGILTGLVVPPMAIVRTITNSVPQTNTLCDDRLITGIIFGVLGCLLGTGLYTTVPRYVVRKEYDPASPPAPPNDWTPSFLTGSPQFTAQMEYGQWLRNGTKMEQSEV